MKKEFDVFLNTLTRHTNLFRPYSDYVKSNGFPEQISDLLGNIVTIKYRNHYRTDVETTVRAAVYTDKDGNKESARPHDDTQMMEDRTPSLYEEEERPHVYSGQFKIVRADAELPYLLIAISTDGYQVVTSSTLRDDDKYIFEKYVSDYPIQINKYIGLGVYDQYAGEIPQLRAAVLRVDDGEPCTSILMEVLGSTGMVRFITGDEAQSILYDYFDADGSRDYDNRHAPDEDNALDVTGEYADVDKHGYVFTDVNGGHSNVFDKLNDIAMTDDEIAEFRLKLLEGKTIYGNNSI